MSDFDKDKAIALTKMLGGSARMIGAVVTGTGHGLLGHTLKNHNMARTAVQIGKHSFLGGKQMFAEGWTAWKQANARNAEKPSPPPTVTTHTQIEE